MNLYDKYKTEQNKSSYIFVLCIIVLYQFMPTLIYRAVL